MNRKTVFFCTLSGEIALKSKRVRQRFEARLEKNLKKSAENLGITFFSLETKPGIIIVSSNDLEKTAFLLKHCFGIYRYARALKETYSSKPEIVEKTASHFLKLSLNAKTFAVRANRHEGSFASMQLNKEIGAKIVELASLKVDLEKPGIEVFVHVFKKNFFVHTNWVFCAGGLPLGVEGSCALLLDNAKESLISAFLLMRRGTKIFPVTKKRNALKEKRFNSVLFKWNNFCKFNFFSLNEIEVLEKKRIELIAVPRIKKIPLKPALSVLPVLNALPQNILESFYKELLV